MNGKEDCTHKSEAKDTTQGIHDTLRVITKTKASEGGKSSW